MRRLMQNLTRLWRYKKLFKLFNRFYYEVNGWRFLLMQRQASCPDQPTETATVPSVQGKLTHALP